MAESVYKVIELIGTSSESWEKATAAAVAKGMSVTFKEMLSPTLTENYPDSPPMLQERYRGAHVRSVTRTAWRSASPASSVPLPARRTAFTSKRRTIPTRRGSPAMT